MQKTNRFVSVLAAIVFALVIAGMQFAWNMRTAEYLKDRSKPDVLVVSPLLRAQQTLAHVQAYFPDVPVMICNKIKPEDDAKAALDWLSQLPYEAIVVVCHMNVVAHMAEILTTESFHPYALAEARIYEQAVIAAGLSTQLESFIPNS